MRSLGYGLGMTVGRLGTIFMPMIVSLMQGNNMNPLVFFGFLGIIAAFCILQLPETIGQPLSDQIQELERNTPLLEKKNYQNLDF